MDLRKINDLVAEHVMGWTPSTPMTRNDRWANYDWVMADRSKIEMALWQPTTDPAAAKQVREKLAETFVYVRVDICRAFPHGKSYICRAWNPENYDAGFRAEMSTEELAVAHCALKAFQVLLPEESQEKV